MAKETANVTQLVGFISMNGIVILLKRFLECIGPNSVKLAESLADETVKVGICSFLGTTFDNHITKLNLIDVIVDPCNKGISGLTSRPSGMFTFMSLCTASSKLSYKLSAMIIKMYRERAYRVHDGQINRPSQID